MGDRTFRKERSSSMLLNLIAGRWIIEIVETLQDRTLRFNELQKALPFITQKVLVETLRRLERGGIIDRRVYPIVPPQVEYKLTPIGLDLLKLSDVLSEWANIHENEIKRAQRSYDRRNK